MPTVVSIDAPVLTEEAGEVVVQAQVEVPWKDGTQTGQLWFRLPHEHAPSPEAAADAFFNLGLVLAMASDGALHLEAPVSAQLVADSAELQDILTYWYPRRLRRTEISAPTRSESPQPGAGVASFFTGGVDSFHSALNGSQPVSTLCFVYGFDIPLSRPDLFAETSEHLQQAAADIGVPLITVTTNLKDFTNRGIYWGPVGHGAGLGTVATLLHRRHHTVLIPASYSYDHLIPWGSHPLTDRMRSTEYLKIFHDGGGFSRVDKTLGFAEMPAAQKHLRVCWQKTGKYNCGECEKCLRTMTTLHLAGLLDQFEVFPHALDLERIRGVRLTYEHFTMENIRLARKVGNAEVAAALNHVIAESRRQKQPPPPAPKPMVRRSLPARLWRLARHPGLLIAKLSRRAR